MARNKRLSFTSAIQDDDAVVNLRPPPGSEFAEEWSALWEKVLARDLIDHPIVPVDAETAVEEACEKLLSGPISCIAVESKTEKGKFEGLFDFADVNAFLTLAATRHTLSKEEMEEHPLFEPILTAAKAGKVPVRLVSNLSEKNSLEILYHDSNFLSLLGVFSRGVHRVLIKAADDSFLGFVTDGAALSYLASIAETTPTVRRFLSNQLDALALPSLYLYTSVVAAAATASVLDGMRLMSEQGVSSIAVLNEEGGSILSAISVTDIGKSVVPTQSNQTLTLQLQQLVSIIREPLGSTDGNERYPVYSVTPESSLSYTIQKLLATNSHRLFVTNSSASGTPTSHSNLCGVVSIVDILALFARVANVPGVDPLRLQRHRRMSSSSSRSGSPRSSSRTGLRARVNSSNNLSPFAPGTSPRSAGFSPSLLPRRPRGSVSSIDGISGFAKGSSSTTSDGANV